MTHKETSLLLYLEHCCVDKAGEYQQRHLNDEDREILTRWTEEGYVSSGRKYVSSGRIAPPKMGYWVRLGDRAWEDAARERKERATRLWANRSWQTTEENRRS